MFDDDFPTRYAEVMELVEAGLLPPDLPESYRLAAKLWRCEWEALGGE